MQTLKIQSFDNKTSATFVPEYGGMGISITMPDAIAESGVRELLYIPDRFNLKQKEPIFCGWPFCFPICARLAPGGQYPLSIHGFGHHKAWSVMSHTDAALSISLSSDDETRAVYPFDFKVELHYSVSDGELKCRCVIFNTGEEDLPVYAGFHPYFLIDPVRYQKSDVQLHAKPKELYLYNEALDDIKGITKPFDFPVTLDQPHINEQLLRVDDNVCELHFPDAQVLQMKVTSPSLLESSDNNPRQSNDRPKGFHFLQLYHIPDEPFFCLEPWMAPPNSLNHDETVPKIVPGEVFEAHLTLTMGVIL